MSNPCPLFDCNLGDDRMRATAAAAAIAAAQLTEAVTMKHVPRAKFSLLADRLFSAFSFRDDDVPLGSELSLEFDGQPVDVRVANGHVQGLSTDARGRAAGTLQQSNWSPWAKRLGTERGTWCGWRAPLRAPLRALLVRDLVARRPASAQKCRRGTSGCASSRAVTWISLQASGRPATCRSTLEVAPSRRLRASRQKAFGCRPGVARSTQRR